MAQEALFNEVALFRGVELSLNRKKREGDRLKRASRKLAHFAVDYAVFFADKFNSAT